MTTLQSPEIKTESEALALGIPTFKFVAEMKAVRKDDDGVKRVHLTASSNATDLTGDVMSEKSLNRMKETAVGKTMFLNHDTTVPESVFGVIENAELVHRTVQVTTMGQEKSFLDMPLVCLEYDVLVEESNPRAIKTWEIINNGKVQLGASVTIAVLDKTRMKDGRTVLEDVYHLETSVVGVPCNQTAWMDRVQNKSWALAAKRVAKAPSPKPRPTLDIKEITSKPVDVGALLTSAANKEKSMAEPEATTGNEVNAEALTAVIKGLFNDVLEEHLENPFFYIDRLIDATCELLWWNYGMDIPARMEMASLMLDEFKVSYMGVIQANLDEQAENIAAESGETVRVYSMSDKMRKAADGLSTAFVQRLAYLSKAGARNSAGDKKILAKCHDGAHDLHEQLVSLGMECKGFDAAAADDVVSNSAPETGKKVNMKDEDIETKDAGDVLVPVKVEDTPEFKAAVEAAVAESKSAIAILEEKVATLEATNKSLTKDTALWKARYGTAVELAEKYANLPAERPGLPAV